jgi:hypothetical protein
MMSPVLTYVYSTLIDPHWHYALELYEAMSSNNT